MNKAFTKEDDGNAPPRLPDLPIRDHPNHVTPKGMEQLKARAAALEAEIARLRENRDFLPDLTPLAVAERDLRYVAARLSSALVVEPPDGLVEKVQFGATVTIVNEGGTKAQFTIVGEDEAIPQDGLIAAFSPLARALMEAQVGDIVEWDKPSGLEELEILSIEYAESCAGD